VRGNLLLCELHAHTTWSDGELTLPELVDLYGTFEFDVLCVTDHLLPPGGEWAGLATEILPAYFEDIEREARRALVQYGLLLLPGLELTQNDADPDRAGHALALGLREPVTLAHGLVDAMGAARAAGAAIVAAHPNGPDPHPESRGTRLFWRRWRELDGLVDRFELFNRTQVFGWVADESLPAIATGDFHRLENLAGWKTFLPCAKDEETVIAYLRSSRRAYLMPWGRELRVGHRVAA
jgi:hypothetical protein